MNNGNVKDELQSTVVRIGERLPCRRDEILHTENEGRNLRIWYVAERTEE